MSAYDELQVRLREQPRTWLVTGVAGFIGSNLLEALLRLGQTVAGLDNFATGYQKNLEVVRQAVTAEQWKRFRFLEGDIRDLTKCRKACAGVDYILHQAALGSVPASLERPADCHAANVTGFLNIALAARDAKAGRLVYASSSAVYGDEPTLPKREEKVGQPLSPYAASKAMDEVYAGVFSRCYGLESVGLRYFNVFGPRQDPDGAYAAVIPKWVSALLKREPVHINGDGETSRDFCYVANVVQANLLAATVPNPAAVNQVYNVAVGERTSLNALFTVLQSSLCKKTTGLPEQKPIYRDFREGDIRHSLADIGKARRLLGYEPKERLQNGLDLAMDWYLQVAHSQA